MLLVLMICELCIYFALYNREFPIEVTFTLLTLKILIVRIGEIPLHVNARNVNAAYNLKMFWFIFILSVNEFLDNQFYLPSNMSTVWEPFIHKKKKNPKTFEILEPYYLLFSNWHLAIKIYVLSEFGSSR